VSIQLRIPGSRARIVERGLLIAGVVLLGVAAAAYAHRTIMVRAELKQFEEARLQESRRAGTSQANATGAAPDSVTASGPAGNIGRNSGSQADPLLQKYALRDSAGGEVRGLVTTTQPGRTLAVLRIPRLHLKVPVLNGTDAVTLNRGVGRIAGTAFPGVAGNLAIAGHRDGFFRSLKEVRSGDRIELATVHATYVYTVDRTLVTDPGDLSVLDQRGNASLTLVTCYPFHYIGAAPRRFVVEASLQK
jgi:sortase A